MSNSATESKKRAKRLRVFIRMLKQNEYPNFISLQKKLLAESHDTQDATFTRQTLLRDIQYLKTLGAHIKFDRSSYNGYYLVNNNWNGYASFLDESEMEAAVLGAQFAERILPPSPLKDKIRGSVDSLWAEHALPDEDTEIQWSSLVIQGLPVKIDPQIFQTVFEQWRSQHYLEIAYKPISDGEEQIFIIEPQILTFNNGTWYIRGKTISPKVQNADHGDFLTFALHRIQKATRVGKLFEPDHEEIKAVNTGKIFDFPRLKDIQLKVRGRAQRLAMETFPIQNEQTAPDGDTVIALQPVEEYKVVNFVLISNGDAEIITPETLREKARLQALAVAASLKPREA